MARSEDGAYRYKVRCLGWGREWWLPCERLERASQPNRAAQAQLLSDAQRGSLARAPGHALFFLYETPHAASWDEEKL